MKQLPYADADRWARGLPAGLDTLVGQRGYVVNDAMAQQISLAAWSWPIRTLWCSTAHSDDRVAVIEDGRVSEIGSHEDLVARGGSYTRLWESWRS